MFLLIKVIFLSNCGQFQGVNIESDDLFPSLDWYLSDVISLKVTKLTA